MVEVDREGIVGSHYKYVAYYFHNTWVGLLVGRNKGYQQAIGADTGWPISQTCHNKNLSDRYEYAMSDAHRSDGIQVREFNTKEQ
jgi:hypothetical protein